MDNIINQQFHYKLVDLIDDTRFGSEAHKVKLLNEKLDPVAWDLLRDLLIALKVVK
jgi:hypothetical protein